MTDIYLHGFGSSAVLFRKTWESAVGRLPYPNLFFDGFEHEPLTGERRWFAFSGLDSQLSDSVARCADRLERKIAALIEPRRPAEVRLFGHSQGGMIALELACRPSLPITSVHSFAAYLPLRRREPGTRRAQCPKVVLHSSLTDRYIARDQVQSTVEFLKANRVADVADRVASGLSHNFSGEWLRASAYMEVQP